MTVIRPNGISGITSITSSGDAINFYKSDGTLGPVLGLNINATTGISTFAALNVTGVLTYEDVTSVDSVGIITARSDLSIADKIIHTGDTNTAIRFPAADTITAETGGVERLRIDSSGRIGIGLANPSQKVHIQDSSGPLLTFDDGTTQFGHVGSFNKLVGSGAVDTFLVSSANSKPLVLRAPSGQEIYFNIASSNAMLIDSSGRLLLGTSTEGYSTSDDLTIATSGNTGMTIRSGTSNYGSIHFSDATSGTGEYAGVVEYAHATNHLAFYTASTQQMRIDSSGRLMLGTTTEGDVNADNLTIADSGHCGMTIRSGTSSYGSIFFSDGTSGDAEYRGQILYNHNNDYMRFQTGAIERMRITSNGEYEFRNASTTVLKSVDTSGSSATDYGQFQFIGIRGADNDSNTYMTINSYGRLGIGNDASFPIFTDDRSLILGAGSGSVGLQLYSSTTGYNGIYFGDANSGSGRYRGYVEYKHNDDWLRFAVNGQERVRIDSSGRMGVGINSPGNKLHVADSTTTPILCQSTGQGAVYLRFQNTNNARGYVGYESKRLAFYTDNGSDTGDTRVAFIDADGLKFYNDTAQANALDDYEEGTWTPSIEGSSGSSGQSYTFRNGKYTKVGRVVTASFSVQLSNKGTLSGINAVISGLPFTVQNTTAAGAGSVSYFGNTSSAVSSMMLNARQNYAHAFLNYVTAAGQTTATNDISIISNTTRIDGVFTYIAQILSPQRLYTNTKPVSFGERP